MKCNIYKSIAIVLLSLLLSLNTSAEATNGTQPTDNLTSISATQDRRPLLKEYVHETVAGIYKNDIGNFDTVLEFSNYSISYQFKTDVLVALFEIMRNATHTGNPLYALKLYNAIEAVINEHDSSLQPNQLEYLIEINNELFYETIIPNGADVLKSAIYLNNHHYENTIVGDLMDLLHVSNATLTHFVVNEIAKSIRNFFTVQEQILRFSNFSNHFEQNIEGLLALHDAQQQFYSAANYDFFFQLKKLLEHQDYFSTVPLSQEQRINEIFPPAIRYLYGEFICLYQEMENGKRLYLENCRSNFLACASIHTALQHFDVFNVFKVNFNASTGGLNFYSKFENRSLGIRSERNKQIGGYNLNVGSFEPSMFEDEVIDLNWKMQLGGNQVLVQNMNSTMYLCAGFEQEQAHASGKIYTRDAENFLLHQDECKWTVQNCHYDFKSNSNLSIQLNSRFIKIRNRKFN